MLWIISGPTSAGKTTFIASARSAEITGLPPTTPLVFPSADAESFELGPSDAFYHYNILRPVMMGGGRRRAKLAMLQGGDFEPDAIDFERDAAWTEVAKSAVAKQAIVLVASKQTLLERIRQRKRVEDPELEGRKVKDYPAQRWLKVIEQIDLGELYQAWCQELRRRDIPYVLVNGSDDRYPTIADEDLLSAFEDGQPSSEDSGGSTYSREQIAELLRERRFGYHRVDLPYGLHTRGDDRSETRDIVLPPSLEGKSVLDVGSAHGYFSFAAEARGAARVVGVELRDDRFRDALLLKDIKGSNVEFIQRDIVLDPLDEAFDHVLLLNVVHHLKDPIRALRQLASITRETLVIEFPTLADRKFNDSLDVDLPSLPDELPLIGVSSMRQGVGQTFVFTPSAIQRILLDHEPLFEEIEILPSPLPGRAIAICRKAKPRD
jgi:2-polyprenyl-3-methyl-5-hydroxy-6-metoxy-1,4-benzoquinol methylase